MKILNLGSLNIDHVYRVPHFVRPGETLAATEFVRNAGGKGLNQSVALGRAGAPVWHAGNIGEDGLFLKTLLDASGVDTTHVEVISNATGHAVIQVDDTGQNCILLHGGANRSFTPEQFDRILGKFAAGDLLLLQNEINDLEALVRKATLRDLRIVLNPSPFDRSLAGLPLELVDTMIVNEVEAEALTGEEQLDAIIRVFHEQYPNTNLLVTLGASGACYTGKSERYSVPGRTVAAIDTTGAGDTFTGYFLAALIAGKEIAICLAEATAAASISVTRMGAAASIPKRAELASGV